MAEITALRRIGPTPDTTDNGPGPVDPLADIACAYRRSAADDTGGGAGQSVGRRWRGRRDLPEGLDELVMLLRDETARKRVLLVLDNVTSSEELP